METKPSTFYTVRFNDFDPICIQSALVGHGDNYLEVEMLMYDKDRQDLKAVLLSKFTQINTRTGRKEDLAAELVEFARQVLVPRSV